MRAGVLTVSNRRTFAAAFARGRYPPHYVAVLLVVLAGVMWWQRVPPAEDGFFYLRYAYNWVSGYGLVYNPGEYYESNTNFLWTVLLAPTFVLGAEPVAYMRLVGIAVAVVNLFLVYDITRRLSAPTVGLAAALLLGLHGTFLFISASGFMPHLGSALALAAIAMWLRYVEAQRGDDDNNPARPRSQKAMKRRTFAAAGKSRIMRGWEAAVGVGLSLSLLLLTRLDSVLLFGVVGGMIFWRWFLVERRALSLALMLGAPVLVYAVYLFWKWRYYGDVLPATYYAKAGSKVPEFYSFSERGARYVWMYIVTYGLAVAAPVCAFFCVAPLRVWYGKVRDKRALLADAKVLTIVCCGLAVVVWAAYMLRVGGGKYEFRFMATVAPFLFILIALALARMPKAVAVLGAAALVGVSLHHHQTFVQQPHTDSLADFSPWESAEGNTRIGRGLRGLFGEFEEYHPDIKIAITAGGYIPFYSRLYTLEMHGWADTRVFVDGNYEIVDEMLAGHQFVATPDFMRRQGINLVFGKVSISRGSHFDGLGESRATESALALILADFADVGAFEFPSDAQIVELPLFSDYKMYALYLVRNSVLDEFFARRQIPRFNIYP